MFEGLRTVIYAAPDIAKTKEWYAQALGIQPYFDEPFYVGFNVGGYELGLDPGWKKPTDDSGTLAYWGVKDVQAAYDRLIELGAKPHHAIQDVGEGIKLATVIDPFGNVVGIIENPHFKLGG
jgi:predicted enzyme related to lactoylglutathione lyase